MVNRISIEVFQGGESSRHERLFRGLEELFPVRFVSSDDPASRKLAEAVLLLSSNRALALQVAKRGLPCFMVLGGERLTEPSASSSPASVNFPGTILVDVLLDGQSLQEFGESGVGALLVLPGDVPIADRNGSVFWSRRSEGRATTDFFAGHLPELRDRDYLCHFFSGDSFCQLLPLLCFLKRLCEPRQDGSRPPARGCFVFDDPSLKTHRYGCLDFRALVQVAEKYGIHAVVATIPIDVGSADTQVCQLFRERSAHISLTPHGNNHVKWELARPWDSGMHLKLMAQALRRVGCLAAQHDLNVSRVMEPPYGVVDHEFIAALAELDYEGVLVTPSQFLRVNTSRDWSPSFGLKCGDMFPGGLAIIPRIVMSKRTLTEMVLAAFLGQPVVVAGHHYDVAHGMDWMAQYAARIQSSVPVHWGSLSTIVQSSFETATRGEILHVRPGSRSIRVSIPKSTRAIIVERPWIQNSAPQLLRVLASTGEILREIKAGMISDPVVVPGGTVLVIQSGWEAIRPTAEVEDPGLAFWPKLRRTLMEARDRVYPWSLKNLRLRLAPSPGR